MLLPIVVAGFFAAAGADAVFESAFSESEFELSANADAAQWKSAPGVKIGHDYQSRDIPGPPTEVRSRWTKTHLYLLYICPYTELNLKPQPSTNAETPRLWNWDVGEAFIGSSGGPITQYRELQVSPQGEWVDLDIDRQRPKEQAGMKWDSGFSVKARIDSSKKVWYGEMKIPFAAIESQPPEKGRTFRAGVYRIAGADPNRQFYAWQPTGQTSFHVPEAFGTLRLK